MGIKTIYICMHMYICNSCMYVRREFYEEMHTYSFEKWSWILGIDNINEFDENPYEQSNCSQLFNYSLKPTVDLSNQPQFFFRIGQFQFHQPSIFIHSYLKHFKFHKMICFRNCDLIHSGLPDYLFIIKFILGKTFYLAIKPNWGLFV